MAFCLVIDGKPAFYTDDLERVKEYADVLLGKLDTKRKADIDIIGGYDPSQPMLVDICPVLYRKCYRCLKMYSFPYFYREEKQAGRCCMHCREKRKAQYRNTYNGYNPSFVDNYIANTFGDGYVVKSKWNKCDYNARPTSALVKGCSGSYNRGIPATKSTPLVSPLKRLVVYSKDSALNPFKENKQTTAVTMPGAPRSLGILTEESKQKEQAKIENKEPLTRRWSYHYVVGLGHPFVHVIDWSFSFSDEVRVVHHGPRPWSDYTLIYYSKIQKDADEKINEFLAEHAEEIRTAEMVKTGFERE